MLVRLWMACSYSRLHLFRLYVVYSLKSKFLIKLRKLLCLGGKVRKWIFLIKPQRKPFSEKVVDLAILQTYSFRNLCRSLHAAHEWRAFYFYRRYFPMLIFYFVQLLLYEKSRFLCLLVAKWSQWSIGVADILRVLQGFMIFSLSMSNHKKITRLIHF